MNLLIDIGNSQVKYYVTNHQQIIQKHQSQYLEKEILKKLLLNISQNSFDGIILSSVRENLSGNIPCFFSEFSKKIVILSTETKLPLYIHYEKTLGADRIATMVGGIDIYPNYSLLIIDLGTAITYDFVNSKREFCGGNITPGLEMRYKALQHYTDKLPNVFGWLTTYQGFGQTTAEALTYGVVQGIIAEIQYHIVLAKQQEQNVKILMTGGDGIFFKEKINSEIEFIEHLAAQGLETILEYNNKL